MAVEVAGEGRANLGFKREQRMDAQALGTERKRLLARVHDGLRARQEDAGCEQLEHPAERLHQSERRAHQTAAAARDPFQPPGA